MCERFTNICQAQRKAVRYGRPGGRHPRRHEASFASQVVGGCLTVGVLTFALAPEIRSFWNVATQGTEKIEADERLVYYQNCDAARAAGVAPIYRGSPGYRKGLDGDNDGIACEPYR